MSTQHVNDIDCERIIIERVGTTVIAFLGYESIPCDHFRPELAHLAGKLDARVPVLWIDVGDHPSFTAELDIKTLPTTLIFRNGDEIARFEGPYSRETLLERIMALL